MRSDFWGADIKYTVVSILCILKYAVYVCMYVCMYYNHGRFTVGVAITAQSLVGRQYYR